jgi:NAD(P)-dependent dehydrogenase (short-subunit alcohol dehydrogenase family)
MPTTSKSLVNVISGKAIAVRLANDGYDVCINDVEANQSGCNEVVKEIQRLGRKSFAYTADVSNLKEVQDLVQASVSELGPLNTMVANAGIAQVKALLDLNEQDLRRMFEVNGKSNRFRVQGYGSDKQQCMAFLTATQLLQSR